MFGRSFALTGILVLAGLSAGAASVRAHALEVECEPLPGHKVRVTSWYSARPKSFPAQDARVRVYGPDHHLLAEGRTDEQGIFIFTYASAEPLEVEVYQNGHRKAQKLTPSGGASSDRAAAQERGGPAPRTLVGSREQDSSAWVKDVLVGVGFLLALAAFVLGVRNARTLRRLEKSEQGTRPR